MNKSLLLAVGLLLVTACGGMNYKGTGTSLSPGSDFIIKGDANADTKVTMLNIVANNLTPPDRLISGGTAYVVWQRGIDAGEWTRLGGLDLARDGRSGSGTYSIPASHFDIIVTAETRVDPLVPSDKTVFEQRIK